MALRVVSVRRKDNSSNRRCNLQCQYLRRSHRLMCRLKHRHWLHRRRQRTPNNGSSRDSPGARLY